MVRMLALLLSILLSAGARAESLETQDCLIIGFDGQFEVTQSASASLKNCYGLESWAGDTLQVAVVSKDNVRSVIDLYKPQGGNLVRFSGLTSNSRGAGWGTFTTLSPKTYFTITPTTTINKSKDINLTLVRVNGVATLLVTVFDTKDPPAPPIGGGGTCDGVFCTDPQGVGSQDSSVPSYSGDFLIELGTASANATTSAACTSGQKPHKGKPKNFAVNEHLKVFEALRDLPAQMKVVYFAALVAPHSLYDIKHRDLYKNQSTSSADLAAFGNWFYGAAAAAAGYDLETTLRGSAAAQQFQNAGTDKPFGEVISDMVNAYTTNSGDNPDDPPVIADGHSYGKDIYMKDARRSSKADSCAVSPAPAAKHGFTGGRAGEGYLASFQRSGPSLFLMGDPVRLLRDASHWRMETFTTSGW